MSTTPTLVFDVSILIVNGLEKLGRVKTRVKVMTPLSLQRFVRISPSTWCHCGEELLEILTNMYKF